MTPFQFRRATDGNDWVMFSAYTEANSPAVFTIDFPVNGLPVLVLRSLKQDDWPKLVEDIKSLFPGSEPRVVSIQNLHLSDSDRAILEFMTGRA